MYESTDAVLVMSYFIVVYSIIFTSKYDLVLVFLLQTVLHSYYYNPHVGQLTVMYF